MMFPSHSPTKFFFLHSSLRMDRLLSSRHKICLWAPHWATGSQVWLQLWTAPQETAACTVWKQVLEPGPNSLHATNHSLVEALSTYKNTKCRNTLCNVKHSPFTSETPSFSWGSHLEYPSPPGSSPTGWGSQIKWSILKASRKTSLILFMLPPKQVN